MYFLGLDIGGTKTAISLGEYVNNDLKILKRDEIKTIGPEETINKMFEFYNNNGYNEFKIEGIGISCGGPLDTNKGKILNPPNLPLWENFNIVKYVKNLFKVEAFLENDANACAVAEHKFGAGKGYKNMIFFTMGTGFGGGIIINNKLYAGTNDNAGEFGHISLEKNGPIGYYKKGSFEGFCSGGGIKQLTKIMANKAKNLENKEMYCNIQTRELARLAHEGDPFAIKVFNKVGDMLGKGLSIVIDILNPELIVIGGIFMRSGDLMVKSMNKSLKKNTLVSSRKVCKIVGAGLKENIGDYGAISIAIDNYED